MQEAYLLHIIANTPPSLKRYKTSFFVPVFVFDTDWRRGRDSNPRALIGQPHFECGSL